MENHFDVIIIGGGAAGMTAGIYLSRAKVKTLIINEGTMGGQMVLTHEIANYPGVESISGYELARIMKSQAVKFGCTLKSNVKITSLNIAGDIKSVTINNKDTFTADGIIIATGGRPRALGVKGEEDFKGRGISYCATCDGDFFQDKEIIVVGGGNSALEEAVSLTRYASKVTIVHQFDHFQAFEQYIEDARNNPRIEMVMESRIIEFNGNEKLEKVKIENISTGTVTEKEIDGVFIFIGYAPNTENLKGIVNLTPNGEIKVDAGMNTGIKGVWGAGDSIAKRFRQVTTAVADGTIAALSAAEYINSLKKELGAAVHN